jgi:TetR/AcrR family transcriptional regulator
MPTRTRPGRPNASRRATAPRRRLAPPGSLPLPDSRQRILDAASAEFARRGFTATTVDRIAAHARINKAMIYYHFHNKQALYRAVLNTIFTLMGDHLAAITASALPPIEKLDRFVRTFVTQGAAHPHFAPLVLREVVEGGRRLDEETYTVMVRVVRTMSGIIDEGCAAGVFQPVDPILLYLTTVWPVMVYLATAPIRSAIARVAHIDIARFDADRFIQHIQGINRRAVMPAAAFPQCPTGVAS